MSSQEVLAAAKRGGETAEHEVFTAVDALEPVSGEQHHDAVATTAIFPSQSLPFESICAVERGALVEIKSTMVVHTEAQRRGRFKLRRNQHQALLEESAFYIFAVCEPVPERKVIAMKLVPAVIVDRLIGDEGVALWRDEGDCRGPKVQLTWSNLFDPGEVEGGE